MGKVRRGLKRTGEIFSFGKARSSGRDYLSSRRKMKALDLDAEALSEAAAKDPGAKGSLRAQMVEASKDLLQRNRKDHILAGMDRETARNTLGKETLKGLGAWGAIGGGAALGRKAMKKESSAAVKTVVKRSKFVKELPRKANEMNTATSGSKDKKAGKIRNGESMLKRAQASYADVRAAAGNAARTRSAMPLGQRGARTLPMSRGPAPRPAALTRKAQAAQPAKGGWLTGGVNKAIASSRAKAGRLKMRQAMPTWMGGHSSSAKTNLKSNASAYGATQKSYAPQGYTGGMDHTRYMAGKAPLNQSTPAAAKPTKTPSWMGGKSTMAPKPTEAPKMSKTAGKAMDLLRKGKDVMTFKGTREGIPNVIRANKELKGQIKSTAKTFLESNTPAKGPLDLKGHLRKHKAKKRMNRDSVLLGLKKTKADAAHKTLKKETGKSVGAWGGVAAAGGSAGFAMKKGKEKKEPTKLGMALDLYKTASRL